MRLTTFLLPLAAAPLAIGAPEPNPVAPRAPASTGGLLSELPGILDGVQDLLSKDTINNLEIIVSGAAKLLASDNIDVLQDILTNAHSLLTKEFVDNTTTLIGDATPVGTPRRNADLHVRSHTDECSFSFLACGGCVETAGWSAGNTIEHEMNFLLLQ